MERIKFIINPSSGRQLMDRKIDSLIKKLLNDGYVVGKYYTKGKDDAVNETMRTCKSGFDLIVVCGGDGTVNEVVKGLMLSEKKIPFTIIASGTVNDFAKYLKLPRSITGIYELIRRKKVISIDVGRIADNYFVNVAAGGLLTSVAHTAQPEIKAILGRTAYYLEGLRELMIDRLEPIKVEIKTPEFVLEEDILLFLISNSSSIGGFKKLAPTAEIVDGLLDVVIIKKAEMGELANIFLSVFTGEHVKHPKVIYFKTESIEINSDNNVTIDIDGEYGGKLPAKFDVIQNAVEILV
ncbi:YegS/Rv2252/BmrU family lipid kinase [Soehngenia saccharolytica]|nr:YegS/Rv2252/BmrU family lipid kinase [Soehngenia saccharolytica]